MEFVSDGCHKLSGYSRSDFEEQRVFWDELIHPNDRDRVRRVVQKAVVAGDAFELEYRIVTRSDDEKWVWERGRFDWSSHWRPGPVPVSFTIPRAGLQLCFRTYRAWPIGAKTNQTGQWNLLATAAINCPDTRAVILKSSVFFGTN